VANKTQKRYSASNWFGRIKSAYGRRDLYAGTTSSLTYRRPLSPITGSMTGIISRREKQMCSYTPEQRLAFGLEIFSYCSNSVNSVGARSIAGKEDIKIR
jgi:hypothetical protein